MRYFDLHCDTLTACYKKGEDLKNNSQHISFEKCPADVYIQCCACWVQENIKKEDAWKYFSDCAELLKRQKKENGINQIITNGDLLKAETGVGTILTIENCSAFAGELSNIQKACDLGVKMATLTWNGANELGSGVRSGENYGLTEFGRKAVKEMERVGIVIDISHASEILFWDVAENTEKPIVASHSNAIKLCSNKRNLTDEQFALIKSRGGIVGLNFFKKFLNDDFENASMENIFEHADYFMSLGGENTVSMGSDFDGCEIPNDMKGIESIAELHNIFAKHNYSEELIDKIFFKNAFDFFKMHIV
ncbi:MAG: membrane dipeptidase [Ruminococcaceae bacterium]|nr:membrane dipeptidase [Oscillospiraceae bacterium]